MSAHVWVVEWSPRGLERWQPLGNILYTEERAAKAEASKFRKANKQCKFRVEQYTRDTKP